MDFTIPRSTSNAKQEERHAPNLEMIATLGHSHQFAEPYKSKSMPIEDFNEIEYKKPFYKIKAPLREHLRQYSRLTQLPVKYEDLASFSDLMDLYDKDGNDTFWKTVIFNQSDTQWITDGLVDIYQTLYGDGSHLNYLHVGSVDFCSYGNSKPFRVKIVNDLNDNHDYFYVKRADASRIYGLELEHIFSPDKMTYLIDGETLVEEHIVGIPVDEFIEKNAGTMVENRIRLAKEFVKFNERCFVRLLGDMRSYNFVVEIIQDFDNMQYRFRAMDFDQQNYEGRKNMYKPQFYKGNLKLVELAQEVMRIETAEQYVNEERAALKKRFLATKQRTRSLLRKMKNDKLSTPENIITLKTELAKYYGQDRFLDCRTMGEILIYNIEASLKIKIFDESSKKQMGIRI